MHIFFSNIKSPQVHKYLLLPMLTHSDTFSKPWSLPQLLKELTFKGIRILQEAALSHTAQTSIYRTIIKNQQTNLFTPPTQTSTTNKQTLTQSSPQQEKKLSYIQTTIGVMKNHKVRTIKEYQANVKLIESTKYFLTDMNQNEITCFEFTTKASTIEERIRYFICKINNSQNSDTRPDQHYNDSFNNEIAQIYLFRPYFQSHNFFIKIITSQDIGFDPRDIFQFIQVFMWKLYSLSTNPYVIPTMDNLYWNGIDLEINFFTFECNSFLRGIKENITPDAFRQIYPLMRIQIYEELLGKQNQKNWKQPDIQDRIEKFLTQELKVRAFLVSLFCFMTLRYPDLITRQQQDVFPYLQWKHSKFEKLIQELPKKWQELLKRQENQAVLKAMSLYFFIDEQYLLDIYRQTFVEQKQVSWEYLFVEKKFYKRIQEIEVLSQFQQYPKQYSKWLNSYDFQNKISQITQIPTQLYQYSLRLQQLQKILTKRHPIQENPFVQMGFLQLQKYILQYLKQERSRMSPTIQEQKNAIEKMFKHCNKNILIANKLQIPTMELQGLNHWFEVFYFHQKLLSHHIFKAMQEFLEFIYRHFQEIISEQLSINYFDDPKQPPKSSSSISIKFTKEHPIMIVIYLLEKKLQLQIYTNSSDVEIIKKIDQQIEETINTTLDSLLKQQQTRIIQEIDQKLKFNKIHPFLDNELRYNPKIKQPIMKQMWNRYNHSEYQKIIIPVLLLDQKHLEGIKTFMKQIENKGLTKEKGGQLQKQYQVETNAIKINLRENEKLHPIVAKTINIIDKLRKSKDPFENMLKMGPLNRLECKKLKSKELKRFSEIQNLNRNQTNIKTDNKGKDQLKQIKRTQQSTQHTEDLLQDIIESPNTASRQQNDTSTDISETQSRHDYLPSKKRSSNDIIFQALSIQKIQEETIKSAKSISTIPTDRTQTLETKSQRGNSSNNQKSYDLTNSNQSVIEAVSEDLEIKKNKNLQGTDTVLNSDSTDIDSNETNSSKSNNSSFTKMQQSSTQSETINQTKKIKIPDMPDMPSYELSSNLYLSQINQMNRSKLLSVKKLQYEKNLYKIYPDIYYQVQFYNNIIQKLLGRSSSLAFYLHENNKIQTSNSKDQSTKDSNSSNSKDRNSGRSQNNGNTRNNNNQSMNFPFNLSEESTADTLQTKQSSTVQHTPYFKKVFELIDISQNLRKQRLENAFKKKKQQPEPVKMPRFGPDKKTLK